MNACGVMPNGRQQAGGEREDRPWSLLVSGEADLGVWIRGGMGRSDLRNDIGR